MKKCTSCGNEYEDSCRFCPSCGAPSANGQQQSQPGTAAPVPPAQPTYAAPKKFCKFCGERIDMECVICPKCGKQVEEIKNANPGVVINNTNTNTNTASARAMANGFYYPVKPKNKWVAILLCLFTFCGHKFYEGKFGMGLLYLFTGGLCGVGVILDLIALLGKPNPYYV